MKVVYLRSSLRDLDWFRFYYEAVFPEGTRQAYEQLSKTFRLLEAHPGMGYPIGRGDKDIFTVADILGVKL